MTSEPYTATELYARFRARAVAAERPYPWRHPVAYCSPGELARLRATYLAHIDRFHFGDDFLILGCYWRIDPEWRSTDTDHRDELRAEALAVMGPHED